MGLQISNDNFGALRIEAVPIDDAHILRQSKHAGLGIPGLGLGCDGSNFDKAKAQVEHFGHDLAILVKARSETDRIRKGFAKDGGFYGDALFRGGGVVPWSQSSFCQGDGEMVSDF